jgi:hypothetical protein
MTPQNATLDSKRTLSRFVSYRSFSSQFQFSLSAVTLEYLSQWYVQYTSTLFHYIHHHEQSCGVRSS